MAGMSTLVSRRHYSLDQLAADTDVPRETIRWWIRNKWVALPEGRGPKRYYTASHRDRIIAIRDMREQQRTTAEIAEFLDSGNDGPDNL